MSALKKRLLALYAIGDKNQPGWDVLKKAAECIDKLEAELKAIRSGQTVTVEYNLSPAMKESAIHNKLIELGWTPPALGDEDE
jgi:hypothetical protein